MKLDYYLLWVEDDTSWYDTTSELFKYNIEEAGFHPILERKKSLDEVIEELTLNGLKKYDILLIDFNLRNSQNGDSIIDYLRDQEVYTDIIFYSSDKHLIIDAIKEHVFEGVYHSDRKELEDKFEKVFKTTIKKIEEINSMRGLIVGETSELDSLIEDCLQKYLSIGFLENFNIEKFITEKILNKQHEKVEFLTRLYNQNGLDGILSHCDAIRKWELLRGLIKANKKHHQYLEEFLSTNGPYQNEVIDIRNKFAHAKVITDSEGKQMLKAQIGVNHYEFNEEEFLTIRTNLIKHRTCLHKLMEIISPAK